jgi:hypothetical protein
VYRGGTEAFIRQTFRLLRKCPGGAGVLIFDKFDPMAADRKKAPHPEPGLNLGIVGEILVGLDALRVESYA